MKILFAWHHGSVSSKLLLCSNSYNHATTINSVSRWLYRIWLIIDLRGVTLLQQFEIFLCPHSNHMLMKKISYFLQNLLFIWCWDFVVASLSQLWDFWPKNTIPTKWFAVNVTLVFIPEPPIVVRRNADTPPTSDPRRSWSNLYIFFFREIIFHENFRVNATIKVEDSLCQRILRKCLNLFRCDEVLGETMSSKKQYLFSIKPCIKCF